MYNCPYCGKELILTDTYGPREYICFGDRNYKEGDIYKCPNHEGFETAAESIEYAAVNDLQYTEINDIVCKSATHNCSGSFYTDKNGKLYPGYPR